MNQSSINIKNRRATFDYEITDTYTAGIVLTGTEIKSIRMGKASLADTYCLVENHEVWVKNMYIAEYFYQIKCRSRFHDSAAAHVHIRTRLRKACDRRGTRQESI